MKVQFFLAATLLTFSLKTHAEQKTYWVDLRKAVAESKEGKKVLASLEEEFKLHRSNLEKQEKEILKHQEDFAKKKSVLSDSALQAKREILQEEAVKFQQEMQKTQAKFQDHKEDVLKPIFERLRKVVDKIATTKGIAFIHQRTENLVYASPELDLTDEVVRAMDQS